MNYLLGIFVILSLSGCTTNKNIDSGYVTQDDAIKHQCLEGRLFATNSSGEVYLGEDCELEK